MSLRRRGALRTLASALRATMRPGSPGIGDRLASVPRLVRATFRGEYAGATRGRLLMILAAIAYVVSPIDLVPEAFLGIFGLADDALVVSWIAAALITETETYLAWERSAPEAASRGPREGPTTVRSHVVR